MSGGARTTTTEPWAEQKPFLTQGFQQAENLFNRFAGEGAPFGLMEQVADVGAERRALSQEAINRDVARYTYEQQAPQAALQNYMASISGDYGGTTTAPGPSGIQSLGQILGVAAPLLGFV